MHLKTILLLLLLSAGYIHTEIFSSMVRLKQSVSYVRDSNVTNQIVAFVKQQREMLDLVKRLNGVSGEFSGKPLFNIKHPLNALTYALFFEGVEPVEATGLVNSSRLRIDGRRFVKNLPTKEDMIGISRAILAAQELYHLPTEKIVKGWFRSHRSRALSRYERVDLVRSLPAMNLNRRYNTLAVANRSLEWLLSAKENLTKRDDAIYLYKSFLDVLKELKCECSAFGHRLFNSLQQFHSLLSVPKNCSEIQPERCAAFTQDTSKPYPHSSFDALCRGEEVTSSIEADFVTPNRLLRCRYVDNNHYSLILEPLKVEELNQDYPNVVVIHDVISDKEANLLKSAQHLLNTGKKMNYKPPLVDIRRHSQWYQLSDEVQTHPLRNKLRGKLAAFTQLHPRSFADISVINFGIVGMERLHFDTKIPSYNATYPNEARTNLVTAILFLNDVPEGGEEVFPHLGIKVKPIQNGALVFSNLYRNGNLDVFSLHGACPVMYGEKWTANQWIVNHGQEFTYPCSLDKFE